MIKQKKEVSYETVSGKQKVLSARSQAVEKVMQKAVT